MYVIAYPPLWYANRYYVLYVHMFVISSVARGLVHNIIAIIISVSPHIVIDTVRNWLQQDVKQNLFDRVIFSSKANVSLVEKFMYASFPLFPSATRVSGGSFTQEPHKNGIESLQNGSVEPESGEQPIVDEQDIVLDISESVSGLNEQKENGAKDDLSTEDLLESLQAIQDQNMQTFEELVQQLGETDPVSIPHHLKVDTSANMYSQSLPRYGSMLSGDGLHERSVSPSLTSRSQSGDLILNPDRIESDV